MNIPGPTGYLPSTQPFIIAAIGANSLGCLLGGPINYHTLALQPKLANLANEITYLQATVG